MQNEPVRPYVETTIGADHHVPEVRLDLDLSPQLMLHPFLLQLGLEEDFQRHDEFVVLVPGQVDVAKLAFAQGAPDVKVINGEFPLEAVR